MKQETLMVIHYCRLNKCNIHKVGEQFTAKMLRIFHRTVDLSLCSQEKMLCDSVVKIYNNASEGR